jgi:hypothetical protein
MEMHVAVYRAGLHQLPGYVARDDIAGLAVIVMASADVSLRRATVRP